MLRQAFSRGDVVLVLFPNSDLRTAKRRPAVVVQADDLQTGLAQTIVVMISSNMARAGLACRVSVHHSSPNVEKYPMTDRTRIILEAVRENLFTEINLSANSIRDTIRRVLDVFDIPVTDLKIFLRQDRDASEAPQ